MSMSGCEDEGKLKTVTYKYKNETASTIQMKVYNNVDSLIDSHEIEPDQQVTTNTTVDEAYGPFFYDTFTYSVGDSIIIEMVDSNKCLTYLDDKNKYRIFDVERYDNFSNSLVEQDEFDLIYIFRQNELDSATTCK